MRTEASRGREGGKPESGAQAEVAPAGPGTRRAGSRQGEIETVLS